MSYVLGGSIGFLGGAIGFLVTALLALLDDWELFGDSGGHCMLALEGAEGLGAGDGLLKEMGGGRATEREQQH